jgi:hypothetical protein
MRTVHQDGRTAEDEPGFHVFDDEADYADERCPYDHVDDRARDGGRLVGSFELALGTVGAARESLLRGVVRAVQPGVRLHRPAGDRLLRVP